MIQQTETQTWDRVALLEVADLLQNNPKSQELVRTEITRLVDSAVVVEQFASWGENGETFTDFLTLATQEKYTFKSRSSNNGIRFRAFASSFVDHLGLDDQFNTLAEEFFTSNTSSPVTFRKSDDRTLLSKRLGREATDKEVSVFGIRTAIEMLLLTTVSDAYNYRQSCDGLILDHRVETIQTQDERYTLRLLKDHYPNEFPEDINTLSWSIPYQWYLKVFELLH